MPSVNGLIETSFDASEPIRQAVALIQAKIRTLEGQKNALNKCAEVDHLLEFANELLSQFSQLQVNVLRVCENQAMIKQVEQHQRDIQVAHDILVINDVLSGMGDETIRADFLRGHNGALLLAESDLECLDKLFKLVTPCRDAEDGNGHTYRQQLAEASEHVISLVDSSTTEILGTTYRDLKKLILAIHNCGYFNNDGNAPSNVANEGQQPHNHDVYQFGCVNHGDIVGAPENTPGKRLNDQQVDATETTACEIQSGDYKKNDYPEDNAVFSTFSQTRPITELIPGSHEICNFLQESQIELDASHFDPAVVAVHPMVPVTALHFAGTQHSDSIHYPMSGHVDEPVVANGPGSNPMMAVSQINQFIHPTQISPHANPMDFHQGIPSPVFTNQSYADLQTFAAAVYGQMPPPQPFIPPADQHSLVQAPKKHLMNVNAAAFESISCKQQPLNARSDDQEKAGESSPHNAVATLEQELSTLSTQDPQDSVSSGYSTQSSQQSGYTTKPIYSSWGGKEGSMRNSGRGSTNGYGNRGSRQNNGFYNGRGSSNYHGYRSYYQNSFNRDSLDGNSNNYNYKRGSNYGGNNRGSGTNSGSTRGSGRGGFGKTLPSNAPQ